MSQPPVSNRLIVFCSTIAEMEREEEKKDSRAGAGKPEALNVVRGSLLSDRVIFQYKELCHKYKI